jgi:hypothetical protein
MDHHCPWIGNCVGAHNLKPFYLFAVYQLAEGLVMLTCIIHRSFVAPDDIEPMSSLGYFSFWFTIILDMPIVFALFGLSLVIFTMNVYSNLTSLEEMKGSTIGGKPVDYEMRVPCVGNKKEYLNEQKAPNPYDVYWPNNITQIMGPTILSWFVPFYIPELKGQGLYYPQIPKVQPEEVIYF